MATAKSDYNIFIRAKDQFSKVMLKAEKAMQGIIAITKKLQKHWLALGATVLAVTKAWDLANQAAQFDQQEQAFTNLAASHNANANAIVKDLKRMSAGTVSTAGIMTGAGKAMLLGIPADKLKGMMGIARAASRITGDTIAKSFDDIATGMGRQSKLILDNLGIIVKVGEASKIYAKEMGIVGRQLTDAEKKQAFMNATLKAGEEIVRRVAVRGLTASEAMAKFTATMQNFGIVAGKILITITSFVGSAFTALSAVVNSIIGLVFRGLEKLVDMLSAIPGAGKFLDPIKEGLKGVADNSFLAAEMAAEMTISQQEVGTAIWGTKKAVDGLNRSLGDTPEVASKAKTRLDEIKKLMAKKGPEVLGAESKELTGLDQEQAGMAIRLEQLQTFHDSRLAMLVAAGASELQIQQATEARNLALTKQAEQAKIALKRNGLSITGKFFGDLSRLGGRHAKKMFEAQKTANTSQAIIDGKAAVQGAFKWGNTIGGLPLGLALAAAAAASAAANIKGIQSQSFGGSAGGISAGGGSVPSAPGLETTPVRLEEERREEAGVRQDITLIVKTETGEVPQSVIDRFMKGFNIAGVERNVKLIPAVIEAE